MPRQDGMELEFGLPLEKGWLERAWQGQRRGESTARGTSGAVRRRGLGGHSELPVRPRVTLGV